MPGTSCVLPVKEFGLVYLDFLRLKSDRIKTTGYSWIVSNPHGAYFTEKVTPVDGCVFVVASGLLRDHLEVGILAPEVYEVQKLRERKVALGKETTVTKRLHEVTIPTLSP